MALGGVLVRCFDLGDSPRQSTEHDLVGRPLVKGDDAAAGQSEEEFRCHRRTEPTRPCGTPVEPLGRLENGEVVPASRTTSCADDDAEEASR